MKKFIEKYNLLFVIGIVILVCVLLSWLLPASQYTSGKLATSANNAMQFGAAAEDTRIGLFDLGTYGILALRYFTEFFVFIFVVAGFYKLLGTVDAYQKITDGIAKKFERVNKVFVAISTLVFAILASLFTTYYALFLLIPFAITILSKLKVDKITGLCATFGGALIGVLASTYSSSVAGVMADSSMLGVSYGNEFLIVLILGLVAYALMMTFVMLRMNKKPESLLEDPFAPAKAEAKEEKATAKKATAKKVAVKKAAPKANVVPLAIILVLLFALTVLGYIAWSAAFNVTAFDDAFNWLTEATIGDFPIYHHLLGTVFTAFGNWDLYTGAVIIFLTTLLIKVIYRLPLAHIYQQFGEGFKRIGKVVVTLLAVYVVLELAAIFPRIAGIDSFILGAEPTGVNAAQLFGSGVLTSIFTVDFSYLATFLGSVFATYADVKIAAVIMQAAYGFAMFIAPTSVLLVSGLALFDLKYTDWFKAMWKFLLALLFVIIILFIIITL